MARRRARRGRRRAARGRHRRADPGAVGTGRPRPRPSGRRAPADARRLHRRRDRRARQGGRRPRQRRRRSPCTSRSTPGCTGSVCAPEAAVALAAAGRRADRARARGRAARTSRSPTSPTIPTPPSSSTRFDAVLADLDAAGLRPALVHARTPAGAARVPGRRASTSCGPASRSTASHPRPSSPIGSCCGPALSLKARVSHVKTLAAGDADLLRPPLPRRAGSPHRDRADRLRRRGPANLAAVGGEVVVGGRRHPVAGTVTMDQLMVDVGDDAVEVGRRGRADRPPGRRRGHRGGVGRAARHDRLRDRLRHRAARVPELSLMAGRVTAHRGAGRGRRRRRWPVRRYTTERVAAPGSAATRRRRRRRRAGPRRSTRSAASRATTAARSA